MQIQPKAKATFSFGKVIESNMHFSHKEEKPCPWSHVEKENRTGRKIELSLVAK